MFEAASDASKVDRMYLDCVALIRHEGRCANTNRDTLDCELHMLLYCRALHLVTHPLLRGLTVSLGTCWLGPLADDSLITLGGTTAGGE